jgi:predicted ATPase/Tfp pilus assembly protein PilF
LIGREAELAEVVERLKNPNCRLLTILGLGDLGKTRLAIQAAHHLLALSQDVCYIPLAAVPSASLLVAQVADSLEFEFYGPQAPQEQILNYLRQKEMLLVLDNFEHLLEGVDFIDDILQTAPGIKILTTSRERLLLQEEQLLHLEGLPFPEEETAEEVSHYPAITLFLQSARQVRPDFQITATNLAPLTRICRQVEGMPLAIILAAAWAEMLTPAEIAAEIDHNSVFRGGFSREAGQEVGETPFRDLLALLKKSLLSRSPTGRFEMHELLRHYAAEKLVDSRETKTYARHCEFFARWMAEKKVRLHESEQADFGEDLENIRHALHWALEERKFEQVGRLIGSLAMYYSNKGRYIETEEMLEQVIQVTQGEPASDSTNEHVLGKALSCQGQAALFLGHYEAATRLRRSLTLFRPEQNRFLVAWTQSSLAIAYGWLGKQEEAEATHQQALEGAVALGAQRLVAEINNSLGTSAYMAGRYIEAQQYFQTCLDTYRKMDAWRNQAGALLNLAETTLQLGDAQAAQQLLEVCIEVCRETNHRYVMAMAYTGLGTICLNMREYSRARTFFQESLSIHRQLNNRAGISSALCRLGNTAMATNELEAAEGFFFARVWRQHKQLARTIT